MNKKGLTLVELLSVIAIIALISVVIFPLVTSNLKTSSKQVNDATKKSIIDSAVLYLGDNVGNENFMKTGTEEVTLQTLVNAGYLDKKIKDVENGKNYNLETSKVIISRTGEDSNYSYIYDIDLKY